MRRVAAISAPLRSANPRGRRALSLLVLSGLSAIIVPHRPRVVAAALRTGKGRALSSKAIERGIEEEQAREIAPCQPHQHSEQPRSPTTSKPIGFRSRRTGRSRRHRASSPAPRTCITTRRTAARCSTARRGCGAPMRGTIAIRSWRRSAPRRPNSTTRRPSNSPSEAVDTALKIALAYHNVRGEGARTRLIGRERGYHGVGFGGISVGGMVNNRKFFGALLAGVDHLPTTYNREHQAFSKGEPDWGAHLADELERIVTLHDASTIAAVIVEPMAGSTGVLPAPKGYLPRLRAICDKHGILLIFDEVITGYGRLGHAFAAERYGVNPDMITFAKGITSGSVPMGGVIVRKGIYDAFMRGPMHVVELFHGYTYSAHPLACAAGLATLDLYREEGLFERARKLEPVWAEAAMSLKGLPNVLDIRCVGLTAGIDLAS